MDLQLSFFPESDTYWVSIAVRVPEKDLSAAEMWVMLLSVCLSSHNPTFQKFALVFFPILVELQLNKDREKHKSKLLKRGVV